MKYTENELLLMNPVDVYNLRKNGIIKRFPLGFFREDVNVDVSIELTKYLIEDVLKWTDEEICKKLSQKTFYENYLRSMLNTVFNASVYEAINATYPNRFNPWELSNVPRNYWTKETAKEATIWLLEEKLKWSDDEICNNLCVKTFEENGLGGMSKCIFNRNVYEIIENAYPGKFKPWQLSVVGRNYWNKQTTKDATKWMIEEKLKWTDEEICKKISVKTFKENGLGGMLLYMFRGSPYEAINATYPNRFKPWELKYSPANYWTKETAKEATRWLIEEKLRWTDDEICKKLNILVFVENGLNGMMQNIFSNSPYQALENAYPGKFKPWELSNVPRNYWTKETAKEATIWLLEEKLKWTDEEICQKISIKTFKENGLGGMLLNMFKGSPYEAINATYPNRFKPWQFNNVPKNYWTKETAKEATR